MPAHKGSKHHKARLTEAQVRAIRKRYAAGDISHLALSLEYDVSPSRIGAITLRKSWKHVT